MNTQGYICVAPITNWSSEVLAAEEMTFESFYEYWQPVFQSEITRWLI